jgi:5'-phosphate synthase pdxT subunit
VETLAERDGHGVMVRHGNVLGTSFHPELTGDDRVHAYFLAMVEPGRRGSRRSRGEVNA